MVRRLVLASASPARLFLLRSAGLHPEVVVSAVAEEGVEHLKPARAVLVLAERKATAVAATYSERVESTPAPLILGCDSLLEFDGQAWGKTDSPDEVVRRWRRLRGSKGWLHTGHYLLDTADGRHAAATDSALVHFGDPSDREIEAYSRTSEALSVAGPFTLEGHSAPWIESIEGSYGTITGASMTVLRRLLSDLGVDMIDLWQ